MKIFRKIEWVDGGPNDRGRTIGFILAENEEEAEKILNVDHSFITIKEISWDEYYEEKEKLENKLLMYKF